MSRAFRFPLERVARVRGLVERIARAEWAAAAARADHAREEQELARGSLERARNECLHARAAGLLDPSALVASEPALDRLARRASDRTAEARTLEFQAGQYEAAWRERDQDVRALTKLEERARERHRAEQEGREAAELDETARMRHARSRKGLPSSSSDTGPATDGVDGPVPTTADAPRVPHR